MKLYKIDPSNQVSFFLYKKIINVSNPFEVVKKLWLRLAPALLFVFVVCGALGVTNAFFANLPLIGTLTTGIGFGVPGEVLGWGDWYVSTYFWCCLLYLGIFYASAKSAFLWVGILMYMTICLKFHGNYTWMGTYYDIICTDFVRGIYSVGLGIITAYLCEKLVALPNNRGRRLFFSVVELSCLFSVFNYIARVSYSHFSFWGIEVVFACLLLCAAHSLGYITQFLNGRYSVQLVSRYVYPIFLSHIVFMRILKTNNYDLSGIIAAFIVFIGAIILGVFEYHVIEQKFVPWLSSCFSTQNMKKE